MYGECFIRSFVRFFLSFFLAIIYSISVVGYSVSVPVLMELAENRTLFIAVFVFSLPLVNQAK